METAPYQLSVSRVAHDCIHPITDFPGRVPETQHAHNDLNSRLARLALNPSGIQEWARTIDPINDIPGGPHVVVDRLAGLQDAALTLVAYARGFKPEDYKGDLRQFFDANGTIQRRLRKGPFDMKHGQIMVPDLIALLDDNLAEIEPKELGHEQIEHVFYASEAALDMSRLPLSFLPNTIQESTSDYMAGKPVGSVAAARHAAYTGLHTVVESVANQDNITPELARLKLSALQQLFAMTFEDSKIMDFYISRGYPEIYAGVFDSKQRLPKIDAAGELMRRPNRLYNTGNEQLDKTAITPWLLKPTARKALADYLPTIRDSLIGESGANKVLTKAQFKGMAHETMWLVDAVMNSEVYDMKVLFRPAITRQDRNLEVHKPVHKRTFDMMVVPLNAPPCLVQLKTSENGAKRSQYANPINVLHEREFNDWNPGRIVNKLTTYEKIMNQELDPVQAKAAVERLSLRSTKELLEPFGIY